MYSLILLILIPIQQTPTNPFGGMLTAIQAMLTPLAVPMATVGVIMWAIAFLATPFLPEWATEMKGYFKKALIVVGCIGFLPGLVAAFGAMGGAGA